MSREEVQISDIEPSVIGEDVTRYAIQIRGVDGNGNEGPWSPILEYESPELLPSLESNNYVEGLSGWRLDNDGTFEVNDGLIRGTLQSANYVPNTSGWALDVNGNVEFSTGTFRGALRIGQNTFNVDSGGNLFIGGSTFATSPFAVNTNGQIEAMSINGSFIQANTIAADRIVANSIGADQIAANSIGANQIRSDYVYAGQIFTNQVSSAQGPFSDVLIPNISAAKITTGTLNANNVTISGQLSSVTLAIGSGNNSFRIDSSGNMWLGNTSFSNAVFRVSNTGNVRSLGRIDVEGGGRLSSAVGVITDLSCDSLESAERAFLWDVQTTSNNGLIVGSSTNAVAYRRVSNDAEISMGNGVPQGATGIPTLRIIKMNTTSVSGPQMIWNSSVGRVFAPGSSRKIKKDIQTAGKLPGFLEAQAVTYYPKHHIEIEGGSIEDLDKNSEEYEDYIQNYTKKQIGFIAEDLHDAGLGIFVIYDKDNNPSAVDYSKIGVALVPYVKELYDRIEELERRLDGS